MSRTRSSIPIRSSARLALIALALCTGGASAQQVYVAVGDSSCGAVPCTSIFRWDGSSSSLIYTHSPANGSIEAIALDEFVNWFAAVDDQAGGTTVLRNGVSIGALPGSPVDMQVGPDGTAYVAVQTTSPALLAGEVHRWDNPGFTLVLTQPAPVNTLVGMDLDRDGDVWTVTEGGPFPSLRLFENGVYTSSYGDREYQDIDIGEDSYLYYAVESVNPALAGEVAMDWPTTSSTIYKQDISVGPIDGLRVQSDLEVVALTGGPTPASPAQLLEDGDPRFTYTGFDLAFDIKAPALYYPDPWTDVGGGAPGIIGVPLLTGEGVLAVGSPGSITLQQVPGFALVMLYVSTLSTPTPFKGGTLYPVPPQHAILTWVNWDGYRNMSWFFGWPSGIAPGTDIYFQYAAQDSSASGGFSVSNALRGTQP